MLSSHLKKWTRDRRPKNTDGDGMEVQKGERDNREGWVGVRIWRGLGMNTDGSRTVNTERGEVSTRSGRR